MAEVKFSENELGHKWDRCVTDGILKTSGGIVIGIVSSLLLFKVRRWPVIFGGGVGFGLAYKNCEQEINASLTKVSLFSQTRLTLQPPASVTEPLVSIADLCSKSRQTRLVAYIGGRTTCC